MAEGTACCLGGWVGGRYCAIAICNVQDWHLHDPAAELVQDCLTANTVDCRIPSHCRQAVASVATS